MSQKIRINVYAKSNGWLFDDLKKRFSQVYIPQAEIIISETPLSSCDAWVAVRTSEVRLSPEPERTVAIVHDLCHHEDIYQPGGERRAVEDAGAIVLSHPQEREILMSYGIDLERQVILDRPLGVLSSFTCRDSMPKDFTIGVVGRDCPRKRFKWVPLIAQKLQEAEVPCHWDLVGKGLEPYATAITGSGISCTQYPRKIYPATTYPGLYQSMDCHLITSHSEAGPLTLFEALASGIPVASTPVGWAPIFEKSAPEYVRTAEDIDGLVEHLIALKENRERIFQKRRAISELVSDYSLDDWFLAVLNLAMYLGSSDPVYLSHLDNCQSPVAV